MAPGQYSARTPAPVHLGELSDLIFTDPSSHREGHLSPRALLALRLQYSCQHADKKYVPCPLDWKPNGGRTAEDLARETAQAEAAEAAAAEAKEAAEKAATAGQAATAPAT